MFTRPDALADATVAEAVRAGWDVRPVAIDYLPVGYGSYHWRATDDRGRSWFVTVDDLADRLRSRAAAHERLRAALGTARALRDGGAAFVVAPTPGAGGDLVRRIDERYVVAVYPLVDGRRPDYDTELTAAERSAVLDLLVRLHAASAGVRRRAGTTDFRLPGRAALLAALSELTSRWDTGPHGEPVRDLLVAGGADRVRRLLRRHDRLAAPLRSQPERMVITHGEPHPGNLVGTAGGWLLVDWDTVLLAPPERDLWWLDIGDGWVADAYVARTGRPVSAEALAFYRLAWDLGDIASFVARFRAPHGDTADDRVARDALDNLLGRPYETR